MSLTGRDPDDPSPGTFRELVLAAGTGPAGTPERRVLLVGNKATTGSEATNVVGRSITDDADAIARLGRRSELYAMYRKYVAMDKDATIHVMCIPESAGVLASTTFTFATNSSASGTVEVSIHGDVFEVPIADGDTPTVVALAVANAITAQDAGRLQVTATPALGVVTVSAATKGPRGDFIIGSGATRGVRMRMTRTNLMTITKGALTSGTVDDDATAAITAMANEEIFYQVLAFSKATAAVGDKQLADWSVMITTQCLPVNGKEQVMIFGMVGTQAEQEAVCEGLNQPWGHGVWMENSDWTPAMLAAYHAAICRSQQVTHPSANFNQYKSGANRVYAVPPHWNVVDRPTAAEVRAALNSGGSPIRALSDGKPELCRWITLYSQIDANTKDYRCREGHIPSATAFYWQQVKAWWATNKQPFVAENPTRGALPTARTTTPGAVEAGVRHIIEELASSNPLGLYSGPILAPDRVADMQARVVATKRVAGISVTSEIWAVEHLNIAEYLIKEVGPAY